MNARENENVRRDRIIHCPTKTGGALRLFGERIHLVRATAILDGDRAKCFSDPGNSIIPLDLFYVLQIRSEKGLLLYRKIVPHLSVILLYYTIIVIYARIIYFKKRLGTYNECIL